MGRRATRALLLAAIVGLAFLLRTTQATEVFVGERVVLAENDPWYHLRRTFLVLEDFPRVASFDPWIDHPRGAPVVFAPLFDLGLAALAKATGTADDPRAFEAVAAFVPPVLGAATCLAVAALAARVAGAAVALPAALLLALFPAHAWYSRLGFVDHHVAVTLLYAILAALALSAVGVDARRPGSETHARLPRAGMTATAAAVLAAGMLAWNGFPLLIAVLDAGLLSAWVASDGPGRRAIARFAAAFQGVAALLVLPGVLSVVRDTGEPVSTRTLSLLHPVVLAAGAAVAGLGILAAGHGRRGASLAAVAVIAGLLLALALPRARTVLGDAWTWVVARNDPFMGAVQESLPIFHGPDGGIDLEGPRIWMTRFFLASPLLLAATLLRVARGGFSDRGRIFLLGWTAPLLALVLLQRRFGETAAPALAVLAADLLVAGGRAVHRRARSAGLGGTMARGLGAAVPVAVAAYALWPYHSGFLASPARLGSLFRAPIRAGAADRADERERAAREESADVRLVRTLARFDGLLQREEASGTSVRGSAGAMNSWPLGHKLLQVARVPVTATPFGSHVGGTAFEDTTDFMLSPDEASALEILDRRGSRWVVVDDQLGTIGASIVGRGGNPRHWYDRRQGPEGPEYSIRSPLAHSTWFRLARLAGSEAEVPVAEGGTVAIPALDHFRLVVDSERDGAPGFVQAWEVVPGARLAVRSAPGASVRASYEWTSDAGRARRHLVTAVADPDGEAHLVLPYSSARADLGQVSAWRVESEGRTNDLRVDEAAVRGGRDLRLDLGA
ncbi:MAG: STT3 domain-containing protein [Alphaproteobacteria bacterium]